MNDDQPTQPLTDADERVLNRDLLWAPGTDAITESQMSAIRTRHSSAAQPIPSKTALGYDHLMAHADRAALLAEVDRLRAENAGYRAAICFETTCTGCAGLLDQTVRLEAENSALLRKLEEQYRLRAENARLRKQVNDYHESASEHTAKFDRQHERLMESEGRIAAARKALFDDAFEGHAQRYRALAHALGIDQSGEGQGNG